MAITLGGAADLVTAISLNQARGAGAEAIRYGVRRDSGGSGGEEVTLVAMRACAGNAVRLRFDTQAENGSQVDLEPAFALLEGASCAPSV
jgi:hypothetical protein